MSAIALGLGSGSEIETFTKEFDLGVGVKEPHSLKP